MANPLRDQVSPRGGGRSPPLSRWFFDESTLVGKCHAMKRILIFALVTLAMAQARFGFSEGAGTEASMTLRCEYDSQQTPQKSETASIAETSADDTGEPAAVFNFKQAKTYQRVTYLVKVGEFAECGFPSGNRVRVKVGEGDGSAYGWCGGNPEVFASVWVNERKLASRVWFAGHCIEEGGVPAPSFHFAAGGDLALKQCSSVRVDSKVAADAESPAAKSVKEPLTVCLDYPEVTRYPKDELEYPPPGKKPQVVDTVELLKGSGEVCDAAMRELRADFDTFGRNANSQMMQLERPNWGKPSATLPNQVVEENESIFDYDNDGKLDSVSRDSSETHYMDAVNLVVRFGSSSTGLDIAEPPAEADTMRIPCQMDSIPHEVDDCPPSSQVADEAGFQMEAQNERETVFFRARYSMVAPFSFHGSNYIGVIGEGDTKDFVGVVRPMPQRTFKSMCLFRRVTENF